MSIGSPITLPLETSFCCEHYLIKKSCIKEASTKPSSLNFHISALCHDIRSKANVKFFPHYLKGDACLHIYRGNGTRAIDSVYLLPVSNLSWAKVVAVENAGLWSTLLMITLHKLLLLRE